MKKRFSLLLILILVFPSNIVFANDNTVNNKVNHTSDLIHDEESIVNSFLLDNANIINTLEKNNEQISPFLLDTNASLFKVAWYNGIKIVNNNYGHSFTGSLMTRAYTGPYTTATFSNSSKASNLIKNNSSWKNILNKHKSSMSVKSTGITSKDFSLSSTFTTGELMTSLNKYNYSVNISYNASTKKWSYNALITDTYDFIWNDYNKTYKNFGVTLGNNVAAYGLKAGHIKKFPVQILVSGNL